jgi:putative SOS response-associated peptidase YedK
MCGRFALTGSLIWLIRLLGLQPLEHFAPRYNIAPGQPLLVFLHDPDAGRFCHDFQLWGLVPSFADNPSDFKGLINARGETIMQKPSFKRAFKYRRCLIPASGFFEWEKPSRQPWFFAPGEGDSLFYFAGIWDIWHGPDGEQINSCAIITTGANRLVAPIHQRMPVILPSNEVLQWLSPDSDTGELLALLRPFSADSMQAWKVDRMVNNVRCDCPECTEKQRIFQPSLF